MGKYLDFSVFDLIVFLVFLLSVSWSSKSGGCLVSTTARMKEIWSKVERKERKGRKRDCSKAWKMNIKGLPNPRKPHVLWRTPRDKQKNRVVWQKYMMLRWTELDKAQRHACARLRSLTWLSTFYIAQLLFFKEIQSHSNYSWPWRHICVYDRGPHNSVTG